MTCSPALRFTSALLALLTAAALLAAVAPSACAADIVKANVAPGVGTYLKDGAAWVGGVAPGAADTGVFNSTFTQTATMATAARLAWLGLEVTTGSTAIALGGSNAANTPLGLGAGGIDMSTAARSLTIGRFEQNANHTWSVGLAVLSRLAASTLTRTATLWRLQEWVLSTLAVL